MKIVNLCHYEGCLFAQRDKMMKQGENAIKSGLQGLNPTPYHRMEEGVQLLCTFVLVKLESTKRKLIGNLTQPNLTNRTFKH